MGDLGFQIWFQGLCLRLGNGSDLGFWKTRFCRTVKGLLHGQAAMNPSLSRDCVVLVAWFWMSVITVVA